MRRRTTIAELSAEFMGSMILVMTGLASTVLFRTVLESDPALGLLASAVMVAFVLCGMIEIFTPVSGAHFNPVVTLVMALERKITGVKGMVFVVFQILGGLTGTALGHLMFWDVIGNVFVVSEITRGAYVYVGELIGTFVLIFTVLMLIKAKSKNLPIFVGFLVGGLVMATSSTLFANPQVTIARMVTGTLAGIRPFDGLVFIVMQTAGAMLAYVVYKLIFAKITYKTDNTDNTEEK